MLRQMNKGRMKGQSTLEYAVLIIIIIGALLSIQVYIKRGIQGRFKDSADQIGDQFKVQGTSLNRTVTTRSNALDLATQTTGQAQRFLGTGEVVIENMEKQIRAVDQEFWQ